MSKEDEILALLETETSSVSKFAEQLKIMKKEINMSQGKDIKDIQSTRSALEMAEQSEDSMERVFTKMTEIFNSDFYKDSKEKERKFAATSRQNYQRGNQNDKIHNL